jgi:drug/metabolite transporter (DMT)-like permease
MVVVMGLTRHPSPNISTDIEQQSLQQSPTPAATPSQLYSLGIAAGLCLAIHFASWITSLAYTSVAASTALVTTNPIWVALLSWAWLGDRPRRSTIIGIGIAFLGGILIAHTGETDTASHPWLGNGLALIGAWSVSVYLLLATIAQRQGVSLQHYMLIVYLSATIVLCPIPLCLGIGYTGYAWTVYLWVALMAMIPQLIGHSVLNWSVRWLPPTHVTLAILLEPVIASIMAYLVFQELPNPWVIIGGAILLLGTVVVIREQFDS